GRPHRTPATRAPAAGGLHNFSRARAAGRRWERSRSARTAATSPPFSAIPHRVTEPSDLKTLPETRRGRTGVEPPHSSPCAARRLLLRPLWHHSAGTVDGIRRARRAVGGP